MKVILTQDVEGLGEKNDVVEAAGGYARNYLIPRGLAKQATKGALRELEVVRRIDERKEARLREEAEKAAEKLATLVLRIPAKTGASGRLFGSVTSQEIAERLLAETGLEVDRRKVHLEAPLKSIGAYTIPITIFKGVTRDLNVEVYSDEIVEEPEEPEEGEAAEPAEEEEPRRRQRRQAADLTVTGADAAAAPEPETAPETEAAPEAAVEPAPAPAEDEAPPAAEPAAEPA